MQFSKLRSASRNCKVLLTAMTFDLFTTLGEKRLKGAEMGEALRSASTRRRRLPRRACPNVRRDLIAASLPCHSSDSIYLEAFVFPPSYRDMLRTICLFVALAATAFAENSGKDETQVWQLEKAYWESVSGRFEFRPAQSL